MTNLLAAASAVNKMQEARDAMKGLFSEEYQQKVEPYMKAIVGTAEKEKCSHMSAMLKLATRPEFKDGMALAMLLSAACEVIERSP